MERKLHSLPLAAPSVDFEHGAARSCVQALITGFFDSSQLEIANIFDRRPYKFLVGRRNSPPRSNTYDHFRGRVLAAAPRLIQNHRRRS
jgi:hypothetical protein